MNYNDYYYKFLGKETAEKLINSLNDKIYNSLRVNLNKVSIDDFLTIFNDLKKHDYVKEAFYFDKELDKLGKNPLHNAGMYYIQEASAMMPVYLMNIQQNDKVLDMCASPGGKSIQIANHLGKEGILLSNEYSYKRAKNLSENIERMGLANVIVSNEESEIIANRFLGYFDKVLLDAPCSGQGMFRKNKEIEKDWSYEKVLQLSKIQKDLILNAYKCLKYNGELIYSTCTFTIEENEEVIKYLLNNSNAEIIEIERNDNFESAIDLNGAIRIYPFNFKGEGHFVAKIRSKDNFNNKISTTNKQASYNDIKMYREFENNYLNIKLDGSFVKFGEHLHLLPNNCFSLDKLKLLRNGLHLGKITKNRFEPSFALALYLKSKDVKNYTDYTFDNREIQSYLNGQTLPTSGKKGYNLICVNNLSLGWSKDDLNIRKNLYPKGLRINYKEE